MRQRASFLSVVPLACLLVTGCSGSNDKEVAALRAELETANAQIKELKAEIARTAKNSDLPAKAKARLVIVRGLRPKWEYPIFEGRNIIGRADEQPVEIDLQPQEPEDRIWSSRQHAVITCTAGAMVIEDLNSTNGTYVNRKRVPPGEKLALAKDDIIQIGEVQMQVLQ
jgi:FHA domain